MLQPNALLSACLWPSKGSISTFATNAHGIFSCICRAAGGSSLVCVGYEKPILRAQIAQPSPRACFVEIVVNLRVPLLSPALSFKTKDSLHAWRILWNRRIWKGQAHAVFYSTDAAAMSYGRAPCACRAPVKTISFSAIASSEAASAFLQRNTMNTRARLMSTLPNLIGTDGDLFGPHRYQ